MASKFDEQLRPPIVHALGGVEIQSAGVGVHV